MMRFIAIGLACLLAAQSISAKDAEDELASKLKQRFPNLSIGAVNESVVAGIYEVVVGHDIFYTDISGRFFFNGSIIDSQTKTNISAMRREEISRIDVRRLALADSFVRVRGTGRRTLYVFSDPDCPYCKQLEGQLEKLDNVTIYTFMFPIASLHSDAARKAESIWCEGNDNARAIRWRSVVVKAEPIVSRSCDNPIGRNIALGTAFGIQGTPSLISADGRKRSGSGDAASIDKWMQLSEPQAH